jgi:autotransporter-associated beta strand protein
MIVTTLLGCCSFAGAAQIQFNLTAASGTNNRLPIAITIPLGTQTQTTNLTGDITANLDIAADSGTHQIPSSGITGIGFVYQNPGHIAFSNTHYSYLLGLQTIDMTNLKATPYTPTPPVPVTFASGSTYNFDAGNHALEINAGIISWAGLSGTGSNNCGTTPISNLTLASTGTLTVVSRMADTLTSSTFSITLNLPVNFSQTLTYSGVQITIATSGSSLNATGAYSQTYLSGPAYWDTGAASGLQAGNGTWSTSNADWSVSTSGSNPLYAWTAAAGTRDACFNTSGSSTITVSGSVAANSLNINGTGYSFGGTGTITVNGGGIIASESATIGCPLSLSTAQAWTTAANKTLAISGIISAGSNALTVRGAGTTSLSGVNTLNTLQVGDSATAGNLKVTGGATTLGNGLVLDNGTANLDGGTLSVGRIARDSGSTGTTTFNFSGGTLRARASNAVFLEGLTDAFVKEGGAKIDSQTFDITIAQDLKHGGTAATDGGLFKSGTSTLTLTGELAYTGNTTINDGTLIIDNQRTTTLLHAISGGGNLTIAISSTLNVPSINVNTLSIGGTTKTVPEPASLVMLAIAGVLGGITAVRSRR